MAEEILEEMEEGEGRGMNTIMGILLLLIVLIGGYLFFENRMASEEVEVPQEETAEITGSTIPEEYTIYAEAVDGDDFVSINTYLLEPGFVVVYDDLDGESGEILGHSSLLASGEIHDIVVLLEDAVEQGDVLYVLLHKDDGDGEFNYPGSDEAVEDEPVTDELGNIIMMTVMVGADDRVPGELTL